MALKTEGFEELAKLLDPASFQARLINRVGKATERVGLDAEREIKEDIAGGNFAKNSPITVAMKGSSRPLVDKGDLLKAINSRVLKWDQAVVGVLRSKQKRDSGGRFKKGGGDNILNIAAVLHEGATITVTDRMRRYIAALSRETNGQTKPLRASTRVIVIPRRPFLESSIKDSQLLRYKDMWEKAVDEALGDLR